MIQPNPQPVDPPKNHENRLTAILIKNQSTTPHCNSQHLTNILSITYCTQPKNPSNRRRDCRHRVNELKKKRRLGLKSQHRRRKISGRRGPVRPKSVRKKSTRRQNKGSSSAPAAAATGRSRRKRATEKDGATERKRVALTSLAGTKTCDRRKSQIPSRRPKRNRQSEIRARAWIGSRNHGQQKSRLSSTKMSSRKHALQITSARTEFMAR
jgi:hypothetical protein